MSGSRVLVLCLDTLGDLTLRQPLLSGLLDAGWNVRLAVRAGYAPLVPFVDSRLSVLLLDLDPTGLSDGTPRQLETMRDLVLAEKADLVVFPASTRSLAEEWLLRRLEGPRTAAFAAGLTHHLRVALAGLLPEADLDAVARATTLVSAADEDHEMARNAALGAAILGRALPEREPVLTLTDAVRSEASAVLGRLGLAPGRYALGCPAGTANNRLKGWPIESFAEQVAHLHERYRLPVLLTGLPGEAHHLEAVVKDAAARGAIAKVHVGDPQRIPLLLGLVAHSRLYLGTDTGPMHFAGALGVPVVAVFGGGHWPRFLPRARRSFVATQELPCFGCGWDCWLSDAACVTTVDRGVVREGIDWILGDAPDERRVHRGRALEPVADHVIRGALAVRRSHEQTWREALERLERDADARLHAMETMGRQLEEMDAARRQDVEALGAHAARLQRDADERLRHMEQLGAIIEEMQGMIEGQRAILSRRAVKLLRRLGLA